MKHIKPFNESKDPEVIELIKTYLAYLIDDNFDVEIAHHPRDNSYNIYISRSKCEREDRLFDWTDVADSIVPMIQYLKTIGFQLDDDRLELRCMSVFGTFKPTIKELDDTQLKRIVNIKIIAIPPR